MNYTYILECNDKTFYTGWTNHLNKRIEAHNSGEGAKYTKGRTPVSLRYVEVYETKQEAMKREYAIKQLSKKDKQKLIETIHPHELIKILQEELSNRHTSNK